MSCETLNQQTTSMNVSVGALPEGFCPSSMQELATAIAARLIVTPTQAFSSFAVGSVEPTSNVGPWLKDCLAWFVFDDTTSRYRPIAKGGFDTVKTFTANGNFTVPDNIFQIQIEAWSGGGGGADSGGSAQGGGGSGAYGQAIRSVTPGQNIALVIGAGGASGPNGVDGGNTTVLGMTCTGGKGSIAGSPFNGGAGGVATGFDINFPGGNGARATTDPGVGGDAPKGGQGGTLNTVDITFFHGKFPGGGAAGGAPGGPSGAVGGTGGNGYIVIWY